MSSPQGIDGGGGVVRWIAPPTKRPKSSTRRTSDTNRIGNAQQPKAPESGSDHDINDKENKLTSLSTSTSHRSAVKIDASLCKVICTFVDEHLKELQKHQKLIVEARASQERDTYTTDSTHIQPVNALKVRDEQTKANSTVKHLTNYLKEVTFLNERCDNPANRHLVDEELANKIAHTKNRIIDALNEFIKSNEDYDLPVKECLRIHSNLCMQAHAINSTSFYTLNRNPSLVDPTTIVLVNEDGQQEELYTIQLQDQAEAEKEKSDLDKSCKDIMKLERDTEEMKRLFTEFYSLVKNQSDQIESIEDNIMIAAHHICEGHTSLSKTKKGLTILIPVTGCMAGALIGGPLGLVVGGKLGGLTIGCVTSILGLFSSFSLRQCFALDKIKSD